MLDGNMYSTMLLKLKFMCNAATLDIANNGPDTIIFKPEEMLGILRFEISRLLQNQTGYTTAKFKQVLQIQKSRHFM